MKTLKVGIGMLLVGIMLFSGLSLSQAAQDNTMTNAELVNILVGILGLEMPANADSLSDEELFEIQANMLAERGIPQFVGMQPDAVVSRGLLANLLYDALMGPTDATTEQKINYLAGLGYITAGGADDAISRSEVISALNTPSLTEAVAEAYSPPPGGDVPGPGSPLLLEEGPSSPI